MILWTVIFLFLFLLMLPLGIGIYWYFANKDSVLPVKSDRKRDPRYFARSFGVRFRKAWEERTDGTVTISSLPERYIDADSLGPENWPTVCEVLVAAKTKDLVPPEPVIFRKELAARKSIHLPEKTVFRAAGALENLTVGSWSTVVRWADGGKSVKVGDHCDLGISTTAGEQLEIGHDCLFRRLFAPVIYLGLKEGANQLREIPCELLKLPFPQARRHKRRIGKKLADENTGLIDASFISRSQLSVDENCIITGSLRAGRGIRMGRGSVVCGNVIADGNIYLGPDCTVLGNLFAQGDIHICRGAVVGREQQIRSIVARGRIRIEADSRIYGYVSNEAGGMICPTGERIREETVLRETFRRKAHALPRSRGLVTALAGGSIAVLLLALMGADRLTRNLGQLREEKQETSVRYETEDYRNQGLLPGVELAGVPQSVSPRWVALSDRALMRCTWSDKDLEKHTRKAGMLLDAVGEAYPAVRRFTMLCPLRIGFEEAFSTDRLFSRIIAEEKEKLRGAEKYMAGELSRRSTFIPVLEQLMAHQSEYIYYRTEETWNIRGSYYAVQEYLKAAGMETFPLESFQEIVRNRIGTTVLVDGEENHYSETPYMYLHDGYNPLLEDLTGGKGRPPMFTTQKGGSGSFMGNSIPVVRMEGLSDNGKTLLVAGGFAGALVPPWLVDQYSNIVFVNMPYFSEAEGHPFWELFEQQQVSDMLLLLSARDISNFYVQQQYEDLSEHASELSRQEGNCDFI